MFSRRLAVAGVTALVMAGLGGCSGAAAGDAAGASTGGGSHVRTVDGATTPHRTPCPDCATAYGTSPP